MAKIWTAEELKVKDGASYRGVGVAHRPGGPWVLHGALNAECATRPEAARALAAFLTQLAQRDEDEYPQRLRDHTVARLKRDIVSGLAAVEDFSARLVADPPYALSWGDATIRSAVCAAVCLRVWDALCAGRPFSAVRAHLLSELVDGARAPSRSTSVMYNFTEEETLAAVAREYGWLEGVEDGPISAGGWDA